MARLPRLVIPSALHHVVQRCHEGVQLFRDEQDYLQFLSWLRQGAHQFHVAIHAYVLMPDHVHFLLTPADAEGLGRLLQWLGRYYVPYYNRKYLRMGSLWQGRYKATVLEAENYFLPCSIFVESNPVRAGLVEDAAAYPWSSYQHHVGQRIDPVLSDHPIFWALGNTPFQREANYKELMAQSLSKSVMDQLRHATQHAWALGSETYVDALSKDATRRLVPGKRGRPRKQPVEVPAD
ncbi:transposase [Undibacterium curvum]|uniref:transposase n=1 Tax=Undibacterium curvum TaxID=2762294 RepID=UPI003D0EF6E6